MSVRLIELKTLPSNTDRNEPEVVYRDMLMKQLSRVSQQAGISYEDIEKRLELRKSLRSAGDTWIVSEAEWAEIKALLTSERWAIVSENICQLVRDVCSAPVSEAKDSLK